MTIDINFFTLAGVSIILMIQTGFISYVKSKFKNHAKMEDTSKITTLEEQAKTNVQAVALIEEKRWELKKELYFELIDILSGQLTTNHRILSEIKKLNTGEDISENVLKQFKDFKVYADRYVNKKSFFKLLLNVETLKILDEFSKSQREFSEELEKKVAGNSAGNMKEILTSHLVSAVNKLIETLKEIITLAKADLFGEMK